MKFSSIPSLWFTANNCRCLLPWTWVEVLIVVAICALKKKKKKQPGFINQIRMHELKGPVILFFFFFFGFLLLLDFLSLPSPPPHPLFFLLFFDAESLQNAAKPSEQNEGSAGRVTLPYPTTTVHN